VNSLRYLSHLTRKSLGSASGSYVHKDEDVQELIANVSERYGLPGVIRFDIGMNTDGYSPKARKLMEESDLAELSFRHLTEYPDNHYRQLRGALSERFGVCPACFVLGAGLESVIDMICRALLNQGDLYLLPAPNFSLFEDWSNRLGAEPLVVPLEGEDLRFTENTVEALKKAMAEYRPKILWLSNPVNPTGQLIDPEWVRRLAEAGAECGTAVVADEAYGEYTDADEGVVSASRFVEKLPNLLVLRTFSKIYGLPSARVGYLMCSSPEINAAVAMYRPYFPFSWFSLYVCQLALADDAYLAKSRALLARRRDEFFAEAGAIRDFVFLPTNTNTVMFRHARLGAEEAAAELLHRGALVADISGVTGIEDKNFLRMTIRRRADNAVFLAACRDLDGSP